MDSLRDVLIRYTSITAREINAAQFLAPNWGVIESLYQAYDVDKINDVVKDLIKKIMLEQAKEEEILNPDDDVFAGSTEEILRLCCRTKVLPLQIRQVGATKKLKLAMADPLDLQTKDVFSRLYQLPVQVVLARESRILHSLKYKFGLQDAFVSLSKESQISLGENAALAQSDEVTSFLSEVFTPETLVQSETVEIEFFDDRAKVNFVLFNGKTYELEVSVQGEDLVRGLLSRSYIAPGEGCLFEGSCELELDSEQGKSLLTGGIAFFREYRSAVGVKNNVLRLSDISINSQHKRLFWESSSKTNMQRLEQMLERKPGVYLAVLPHRSFAWHALSAIENRYPDCIMMSPREALSDQERLVSYAGHTRCILSISASGIFSAIKQLERLPLFVRKHVVGLFAHVRVPRACPFCLEECRASEDTLALLPPHVARMIQILRYPRGCPVCAESGYIGTVGAVSVFDCDTPAGNLFRNGKSGNAVIHALRSEKFSSVLQVLLEAGLAGSTSVEMVSRVMFGSESIPRECALAKGKTLVRDGMESDEPGTPLENSPLHSVVESSDSEGFQSVVYELPDDLLTRGEELSLEEFGSD